jgi:hypothetical protein
VSSSEAKEVGAIDVQDVTALGSNKIGDQTLTSLSDWPNREDPASDMQLQPFALSGCPQFQKSGYQISSRWE